MPVSYPSHEIWQSIQGGEPLILSSQNNSMFHIAHVYDETMPLADRLKSNEIPVYSEELASKILHYGCVIDTPKQQFLDSCARQMGLIIQTAGSVAMPAVLLIDRHGKPCSSRSQSGGYEGGYINYGSKAEWAKYLDKKVSAGWLVWAIEKHKPNQHRLQNLGPLGNFNY